MENAVTVFNPKDLQTDLPVVSASAAIEQTRAVAEAQAAMVIAKSSPRDEYASFNKIMKACERQSLANTAMYAYKRGTTLVEGPSIRLAEVLARYWQNMKYGLREISRGNGESEVEAFAWDLETNTQVTRQFVVRHSIDTKGGSKNLTAERDIYEHTANMGQRRVRACILELIPGDIVEEAVNMCKQTIAKGDGTPIEDRIRKMLKAFEDIGVTKAMIEDWLQHKVTALVPAQLTKLIQIYNSINTGVAAREEFFNLNAGADGLNKKFGGSKTKQPETGNTEKPEQEPEPPKKSNPENKEQVKEPETELSTLSKIKGNEDYRIDPTVPGEDFQVQARRCKTSRMLDKWRASNSSKIISTLGDDDYALFSEWTQVLYETWKQEEAASSSLEVEG